jgi:hypothetical protein
MTNRWRLLDRGHGPSFPKPSPALYLPCRMTWQIQCCETLRDDHRKGSRSNSVCWPGGVGGGGTPLLIRCTSIGVGRCRRGLCPDETARKPEVAGGHVMSEALAGLHKCALVLYRPTGTRYGCDCKCKFKRVGTCRNEEGKICSPQLPAPAVRFMTCISSP